ncbi:hypothetical protein CHARACLAT_030164, partial [Characodon lateralis]|nr:hypothetical protein [Characodon lateralis]
SQTVEECGQRLKIILESQSNPQPNHHLLVHLSQYLNQVSQQSHTSPRLLGQTFTKIFFKHYLRAEGIQKLHIRILEALTAFGGLEMQSAP